MAAFFAARPQKLGRISRRPRRRKWRGDSSRPARSELPRRSWARSRCWRAPVSARCCSRIRLPGPQKIDRFFEAAEPDQSDRYCRKRVQRARIRGGCGAAGRAAEVIIEVDTGMHRCGTATPEETVALAAGSRSRPGSDYRGMMGYEGHAVLMPEGRSESHRRARL